MTSYLEHGINIVNQSRIDSANKLKGSHVVKKMCPVCKKTTEHSFKFVQIRSADEGKTGIATCSVCNTVYRQD